jgi:tRNA isopentenyl-2-thiomethyl-A-37 hydroxylase MiaE
MTIKTDIEQMQKEIDRLRDRIGRGIFYDNSSREDFVLKCSWLEEKLSGYKLALKSELEFLEYLKDEQGISGAIDNRIEEIREILK